MPIMKQKYVRKPLYVDAVQVTHENFRDIVKWVRGAIRSSDGTEIGPRNIDTHKHYIQVQVHNPISTRQTKAYVGDWILYTDRGYKIYTDKAFRNSFVLSEKPVIKEPILGEIADRRGPQVAVKGGRRSYDPIGVADDDKASLGGRKGDTFPEAKPMPAAEIVTVHPNSPTSLEMVMNDVLGEIPSRLLTNEERARVMDAVRDLETPGLRMLCELDLNKHQERHSMITAE